MAKMKKVDKVKKKKHDKKFIRLEESEGRKHSLRHIESFMKRNDFREYVAKTRKEFDIPNGGYKNSTKHPHPPKFWKHSKNTTIRERLYKEAQEWAVKWGLPAVDTSEVVEGYIFYDEVKLPYRHNVFHKCMVEDVLEEKRSKGLEITEDDITYPIAIRIDSGVSENTVVDFVKRVFYPEINDLQKKYTKKDTPVCHRRGDPRIQKRNERIYILRTVEKLPYKKIASIIYDELGEELDVGHLTKIISKEKKMRTKT